MNSQADGHATWFEVINAEDDAGPASGRARPGLSRSVNFPVEQPAAGRVRPPSHTPRKAR